MPFVALVGRVTRGLLRVGANSPRAWPTISGAIVSETARSPVRTRIRRPTLEATRRTDRGLTMLSLLFIVPERLDSSRRRRIGGTNGGFQLERDIFTSYRCVQESESDFDDEVLVSVALLLATLEKSQTDVLRPYYPHEGGQRDF